MVRKISINDLQNAVNGAYEEYKDLKKGAVDPRLGTVNGDAFGITVMLTDGRKIERGDVTARVALGNIATMPVHKLLFEQYTVKGLAKKAGKTSNHAVREFKLPVNTHLVKAVSLVEPQNDKDGKYNLIMDSILDMMGSEPVLDDKLYQTLSKEIIDDNVENKMAEAGFEIFDNAKTTLDDVAKLESLTVTTTQLATMGATIAADGVNPVTNQTVFDGSLSAPLTTIAAVEGNPSRNRRWLLKSGVPAVFSFAGLVLAIMPGVGAIAAYGPEVGKHGRSKKGARAVRYITNTLGYNVFGSARIEFVGKEEPVMA